MHDHDPRLTDMRQASGWYAILPKPPPANRLKGNQVADWVVVGAGVTGLAAARRLGELAPDARILLLESYRVGYGASGRNSGFIIDTPHLSEEVGVDINRRLSRLVVRQPMLRWPVPRSVLPAVANTNTFLRSRIACTVPAWLRCWQALQ